MRRIWFTGLLGAGVTAVIAATALPLLAADDPPEIRLRPVADTTETQVPQDGDTGVKTTLATCPRLCDGNPAGRRVAVLDFTVAGLPANAVDIRATLRLHTWNAAAVRVVAGVPGGADLQTRDTVAKGYNEFAVRAAVTGNGPVRFAVRQETGSTRTYWASAENAAASVRPELVVTYTLGTPPTTTPPATTPPATTPPATTPPAGEVPGWRQVWADEFNDSTVDRTRWNVRNEGRDIDLGCNTSRPENVFESGGTLTIRARKEAWTCAGQQRQYTEGYLDTIGKASFTYGRFEMRALSPNQPATSKGLWPAFWLRPDDGGKGEIDVVELPGGSQYHRAATQAIFYDYTPVKQDQRWTFPAGYPADGYHTYTTEWEPGVLRWYIDGRLVWTRDRTTTPWFDEAFSRPFNLRLNFQVGGWLGSPDATNVFPADFKVDYVRVWQR